MEIYVMITVPFWKIKKIVEAEKTLGQKIYPTKQFFFVTSLTDDNRQ